MNTDTGLLEGNSSLLHYRLLSVSIIWPIWLENSKQDPKISYFMGTNGKKVPKCWKGQEGKPLIWLYYI